MLRKLAVNRYIAEISSLLKAVIFEKQPIGLDKRRGKAENLQQFLNERLTIPKYPPLIDIVRLNLK